MQNERGSRPYRRKIAARPAVPKSVAYTGECSQETVPSTVPLPEAPEAASDGSAPAPGNEDATVADAISPGPRRSSGPFQNEVITSHDLTSPPPPPTWARSPIPAPVSWPQLPGGEAHRDAALTHVPWQASDSWGATTLNIGANTAAGGSYLIWWVTGFLIYFSERNNRFVRFHALQSIILTGILTILAVFAALFATVMQDLTNATHQVIFSHIGIGGATLLVLAIAFLWLWAMVAAWTGNYLRLPVIGAYAERYSAPPAQPTRNPLW